MEEIKGIASKTREAIDSVKSAIGRLETFQRLLSSMEETLNEIGEEVKMANKRAEDAEGVISALEDSTPEISEIFIQGMRDVLDLWGDGREKERIERMILFIKKGGWEIDSISFLAEIHAA